MDLNLISTGKTTIYSSFPELATKTIYQHNNGETTDFQFCSRKRIFVEINKQSGLELLRIKNCTENESSTIQRVQKLKIENVFCIACAKQTTEQIALGLSNGQVKLYNYSSSQITHRFSGNNIRNGVIFADYNAADEYIASVFENGTINLYGIKTNKKIESIIIDGNSTLARFHPTKKFNLSVASHKGSVTLYDVQAKKKLFNSVETHSAPCRDLCMSPGSPDLLISVGYDCIVNVFDTRRKLRPQQVRNSHPLSTVALSDCGIYFCVGNLKGELISFDMRNLKNHLVSKKVHESSVTRVAFVPNEKTIQSRNSKTESPSMQQHTSDSTIENVSDQKLLNANTMEESDTHSTPGACSRDSFFDFIDAQKTKNTLSQFNLRRDSFDWQALGGANNGNDNHEMNMVGSRFTSIDQSNYVSPDVKVLQTEFVQQNNNNDIEAGPLQDRSNLPNSTQVNRKLKLIEEEKSNHSSAIDVDSDNSEKENQNLNKPCGTSNENKKQSIFDCAQVPEDGYIEEKKTELSNVTNTIPTEIEMSQQFFEFRNEMIRRFSELEMDLNFKAESRKFQIFTQATNLHNLTLEPIREIRDALQILLQTDPFYNEFNRLKEENRMLKNQIAQLQGQNSAN